MGRAGCAENRQAFSRHGARTRYPFGCNTPAAVAAETCLCQHPRRAPLRDGCVLVQCTSTIAVVGADNLHLSSFQLYHSNGDLGNAPPQGEREELGPRADNTAQSAHVASPAPVPLPVPAASVVPAAPPARRGVTPTGCGSTGWESRSAQLLPRPLPSGEWGYCPALAFEHNISVQRWTGRSWSTIVCFSFFWRSGYGGSRGTSEGMRHELYLEMSEIAVLADSHII